MQLLIRHHFRNLGDYYVTSFFQKLYDSLVERYKDQINFEIRNNLDYEDKGYGGIYSCMHMSIINPINNKYILISFFDNWKYHFYKSLGWDPNNMMLFLYPAGFNYIDYYNFKYNNKNNLDVVCPNNISKIYHSFPYSMYNNIEKNIIDAIFQKRKNINLINKLYFRGTLFHGHYNNIRSDVYHAVSDKSILFIDKETEINTIVGADYLNDIIQYKAALSLPGGTEVCNRDIECFGLGIPLIRPHLDIQYHDPLVSNFHYINCFHDCKYWDGVPCYLNNTALAEYIEYYWNTIKNNNEYLDFISINAREWYKRNCTLEANTDLV